MSKELLYDRPTTADAKEQEERGYNLANEIIEELTHAGLIGRQRTVSLAGSAYSWSDQTSNTVGRARVWPSKRRSYSTQNVAKTSSGHPALAFGSLGVLAFIFYSEKVHWLIGAALGYAISRLT